MQLFRRDSIDRLILRIVPSVLIVIHGVTRAHDGGVAGFGEFLSSQGVPMGHVVAWILTIVEIVGGVALAAGHFQRALAARAAWSTACFSSRVLRRSVCDPDDLNRRRR